MIWAFVDYENIGSLEALNISEYEKVFIFCGPRNTKIKFGTLPSDGFSSIELIAVTTFGANNLDFHLAFHVGRYHEMADGSIAFHIVSNDSGFNGLVNHLKKIGRNCKKVSTKAARPVPGTESDFGECASLVLAKLRKIDGRTRPRKRAKFMNWIKSQCQGIPGATKPEAVCEELVKAKIVRQSGSDITYDLER